MSSTNVCDCCGCRDNACIVERGSPLGLTVRLGNHPHPCSSPTVSSPMFAPQMMARITMNRDSADLGRDNDTGRKQLASSLTIPRVLLIFWDGLSKEENIFPVLMFVALVLGLHGW